MQTATRAGLAAQIAQRINQSAGQLKNEWESSAIRHFVCDDLLPKAIAHSIYTAFPEPESMMLKKSLKEFKYVAAQMNKYNPLLEEIVYAFQDPEVVRLIAYITGIEQLSPDVNLYAGGVSLMGEGHFLNPHLDNSHNYDRTSYRVLNLLYYVSPGWEPQFGGSLELWPDGPEGSRLTIESRFNRLVVMITDETSWHSVSQIATPLKRCCVSNYYFSPKPVAHRDYVHVTSFRGRPEQPMRDAYLRADIAIRQFIWRVVPRKFLKNPHVYNKKDKE